MATAIAARHVYKHRGTGLTGHCRPACAAGRPRRRQRPADLEPCSTPVFDGLPAQTIASSSTLKRVFFLVPGFGNQNPEALTHPS